MDERPLDTILWAREARIDLSDRYATGRGTSLERLVERASPALTRLGQTMVHVFSFRFLERITGAGVQALRSFRRFPASGGSRGTGSDASPPAKDEGAAGIFRAATEKLAINSAIAPLPEAASPPQPSAMQEPAATPAPAALATMATAGPVLDRDPASEAYETYDEDAPSGLSADEQAAFRAIAAMLGSRIEPPAPKAAAPPRDDGSRAPGQVRGVPKVAAESGAILDLVPIGIVVVRDRAPVFVNRFLLDLLGVADLGAARAAAGFDGLARLLSGRPLGAEVVELEVGSGSIAMIASLHEILWDGAAANLACLRPHAESGWKRIEEELRDARRQAEHASALKSDFLAKVSHEIRTPLNAILGFAEVILDERFGPIGNARYKEYLEDIHASGAHVTSLVNDLLDLSKIEAGKMDLAFAPVDANGIVAECVSIMQPQASRERVVLRLALAPELPPVLADERSLRQIILNLLSNAVKFNEPGGQVVVATALGASGQALLRVEDTGIGMSDTEIEIALEPFGRVTGTRPSIGTGLGLPLTKALVEANGARFSITSKKSEGTLVEIVFPAS